MINPYDADEYGLGIVNLKRNGITILGHNGSIPGFGSVAFNNNKGESIFVFSNLKQFPVATVSLDTIQLLAALNIEMPKKINRTEYSKVIPNLTDYVGLYTLKSDSNYRFNVLYNSSDNYLYYKESCGFNGHTGNKWSPFSMDWSGYITSETCPEGETCYNPEGLCA